MGILLSIGYIFMSFIQKNWRILRAAHARQSFHFQKITGTLKMNELSLQKPSFYVKEQLSKIKFKIIIYFLSKMAKTVFDLKIVF